MVSDIAIRRDTSGGSVAGMRLFVSSSGAVDVVVSPVGGNGSDGFVDCGPWF